MNVEYLKQHGLWPLIVAEGEVGKCPKCPRTISGPANFCYRCGTKLQKMGRIERVFSKIAPFQLFKRRKA
ncbi:hypothetical protein GCM10025859_51660 [Alicyclobacillus fastidiosus]|nr:hypothetical protein GCM10025859_51660 [Alicyclobacillus fastidiosus]